MTPYKKRVRTQRVRAMNEVLQKLYPEAKIALHYSNDFECLIAVQLSAQCTDERVNIVTEKLFQKYTTLDAYAEASLLEMERDVFQTGFYRNKAKNIIAAAKRVRDVYGGILPKTLEELITIPGAARKTANVVLSTLYNIHEGIAVDTHVRRFVIRFNLSDYSDPIRIERDLMQIMPRELWWGFNHRLVNYGRDYCRAHKHDCTNHPLTHIYPKANTMWPKAK